MQSNRHLPAVKRMMMADPQAKECKSSNATKRSRSLDMYLVGYFLSRCGEPRESKPSLPPNRLRVKTWKDAYAMFHSKLGDGRSPETFANSLRAVRDGFDTWTRPSGREGWVDASGRHLGQPYGPHSIVIQTWGQRTDSELWDAVKPFAWPPRR